MAVNNVSMKQHNILPIPPNKYGEKDDSAGVRGNSTKGAQALAPVSPTPQHLPFIDASDSVDKKKPRPIGPGMPPPNTDFMNTINLP
tara:strand:- start:260 stop:520 length:261 start_codon:yes stop_codon:yes gene_type:complete